MITEVQNILELVENTIQLIKSSLRSNDVGDELKYKIDGDVTKKIDVIAEDFIVQTLLKLSNDVAIISEELDVQNIDDSKFYIALVDPVDGTDNFLRALSLAKSAADKQTIKLKLDNL